MGWLSKLFSPNSESDTQLAKASRESSQTNETEEDAGILERIGALMTDIDKKFEGDEDFDRDEDVPYEEDYENYRYWKNAEKVDAKIEALRDYSPKLRSKTIARIIGIPLEDVNDKLKDLKLNSADFVGEETAEEKQLREVREKFESLKPNLVNMTLDQIASEIGATERSTISRLGRAKLYCLDWDGSDPEIKKLYGSMQPRIICPHCHTKECVRKMDAKGDVVLNSKNLYRQKDVLKMHCDNCKMDWIA